MDRTRQRALAESLFDRKMKREGTDTALTEEHAEHAGVVKKMQRLRALRLSTKGKNALEAAIGEAQDSEAKNQIKRIRKWLTVIGVSTSHPLTFLVVGVYVII